MAISSKTSAEAMRRRPAIILILEGAVADDVIRHYGTDFPQYNPYYIASEAMLIMIKYSARSFLHIHWQRSTFHYRSILLPLSNCWNSLYNQAKWESKKWRNNNSRLIIFIILTILIALSIGICVYDLLAYFYNKICCRENISMSALARICCR